jgi:hypothetical protein
VLLRALIAVLALVGIVLLGLLAALLRDPVAARRRALALFRRPERQPTPPEAEHYYRRYWS